jgi:hypothetical protein
MNPLLALAERVEKAEVPDRELDVAIVRALHPGIGPYEPHCVGEEPIFWHDPYRKTLCPKFTASVDAALTLVPDGYGWNVQGNTNVFHALVSSYPGNARTPALALCAAALRARATLTARDAATETRNG